MNTSIVATQWWMNTSSSVDEHYTGSTTSQHAWVLPLEQRKSRISTISHHITTSNWLHSSKSEVPWVDGQPFQHGRKVSSCKAISPSGQFFSSDRSCTIRRWKAVVASRHAAAMKVQTLGFRCCSGQLQLQVPNQPYRVKDIGQCYTMEWNQQQPTRILTGKCESNMTYIEHHTNLWCFVA